jgi:hypothetical protein
VGTTRRVRRILGWGTARGHRAVDLGWETLPRPSSQRPCHGYCGLWLDEARPLIGHTSLSTAAAAALTRLPMPWSYIAGTAGRAIGNARAWGPAHVQH